MGRVLRLSVRVGIDRFGNPAVDGYRVADWAGKGPFMYPHRMAKATQYANGPNYDSSLVKHWQYDWRLWR